MFYDEMLEKFLIENKAEARLLRFDQPVRSVKEASQVAKVSEDGLIKTVVFFNEDTGCIACVVLGTDRVDMKKVKSLLRIKNLKFADASEILRTTGYPIGGVPPVGFPAKWFIDPKVLKKKHVIAGGGSDTCLLKIVPMEIIRLNNAKVVDIIQVGA